MDLSTRISRRNLPVRREPHWHRISAGCYLGYRVSRKEGDGTWIARWRSPDTGKQHTHSLGSFADFDPARRAAQDWFDHMTQSGGAALLDVAGVCRQYLTDLRTAGRDSAAKDAEGRFEKYVFKSPLARVPVTELRPRHVRDWRDEVAKHVSADSTNRNHATLQAALNHAHRELLISTDAAWRGLAFLPKSGQRRERWLTLEERQQLLSHCSGAFLPFIQALMLSGFRPGEIAPVKVGAFDKVAGTIKVSGKTGVRTVPVSPAFRELLVAQSKDKLPGALLFPDGNGKQWKAQTWRYPFRIAASKCGWGHEVSAYSLRHSYITEQIMAGTPVFIVATVVGTGSNMIDKHYGHLCPTAASEQLGAVPMI